VGQSHPVLSNLRDARMSIGLIVCYRIDWVAQMARNSRHLIARPEQFPPSAWLRSSPCTLPNHPLLTSRSVPLPSASCSVYLTSNSVGNLGVVGRPRSRRRRRYTDLAIQRAWNPFRISRSRVDDRHSIRTSHPVRVQFDRCKEPLDGFYTD
jgi:hypothetical protein